MDIIVGQGSLSSAQASNGVYYCTLDVSGNNRGRWRGVSDRRRQLIARHHRLNGQQIYLIYSSENLFIYLNIYIRIIYVRTVLCRFERTSVSLRCRESAVGEPRASVV